MFNQYAQYINHVNKVPQYDPHDPSYWMTHEQASAISSSVGFVFTDKDPYWFLDIDHCIIDGTYSPIAQELMRVFVNCYIEVSQSGEGLHIFGIGDVPPHGNKNKELGIEFYTEKRFVALTGNKVGAGTEECDCSSVMDWLVDTYFGAPMDVSPDNWTTEPVTAWNGSDDDELLIAKALSGKSNFAMYYYADLEEGYDESSADMSLATHLAFWTGKDCERIERIMRKSKLVRDKWDRRERGPGYLKTTIMRACAVSDDVYGVAPVPMVVQGDDNYRVGLQFLSINGQPEYFKGCVYIGVFNAIYSPDTSYLMKPDQFKAIYGGYIFAIDSMNDKTTEDAWKAFTQSRAINFPKVDTVCFKPLIPQGEIIDEEGITMVNTHVEINIERTKGDASPFINHIKKMYPNERDHTILISYLAAIAQYPGIKFQWAPIIQGAEGNGKTLITRVMEYAVGKRYTYLPKASDLGDNGIKFNKWMERCKLVVIEEMYSSHRRDMNEAMKPMITDVRLEIQGKGADQQTIEVCFNCLFMTNHRDAVITTANTRRYCILWGKHQTYADIIADGMDDNYFSELYKWINGVGAAITFDYLMGYEIQDKYNPATLCQRAPATSSSVDATYMSLGGAEQEVLDAIESGTVGFKAGWVSSIMLDRLIKETGYSLRIPRNKRKAMMEQLGYKWHPSLTLGRVNSLLMNEEGKPKLFVKENHLSLKLSGAGEVLRAYCNAQGYANELKLASSALPD